MSGSDIPVERQFRRVLHHFFGSSSQLPILVAVAFLISLGWLSDSLADLFKGLLGRLTRWPDWVGVALLALPFLVIWRVVAAIAKKATGEAYVRLRQEENPAQVKALILFLSLPTRPQELDQFLQLQGDLRDAGIRASLGGNPLRMPLEAIAYHFGRLKTIFVLESKERDSRTPGQGGSIEIRAEFAKKLRELALPAGVALRYADELGWAPGKGIDFFDLEETFAATSAALRKLTAEGIGANDILIDISGGTKFTTCAAACVAFGEDRRYQYIHTNTYGVFVCDPVYDQT